MTQPNRGHWRIQGPKDFNGTLHGIEFTNGFGYLNWHTLGEEGTRAALDRIGHDPRGFRIAEIPEQESPYGSKTSGPKPAAPSVQTRKAARKARK